MTIFNVCRCDSTNSHRVLEKTTLELLLPQFEFLTEDEKQQFVWLFELVYLETRSSHELEELRSRILDHSHRKIER